MKKILFCSPYKQEIGYVQGGMAMWGANIVKYASSLLENQVTLVPVSFDRKTYNGNKKNKLSRLLSGFNELRGAVKEVNSLIKTREYDCIHLCTSASLSLLKDLIILRAAKKYGVKSAIHFHFGRIPEILKHGGWEKNLLKKVMKLADVAVTMNNSSYIALQDFGYTNVVNLPNPLSLDIIQEIKQMEGTFKRVPNRILYVGHVVRTKGVWELVEACSKTQGVELQIVGRITEEQKAELRQLAGKDADKWCSFIGEISHEQVLEEFLKAGVFVFPSYSEGFPNVILEAMACGCPIASSDVGAIPEMLDIYGTPCGICFKSQSVVEVEKAIYNLVFDENKKQDLAKKARRRVNENYAMPIVWKKLVDIWSNTTLII